MAGTNGNNYLSKYLPKELHIAPARKAGTNGNHQIGEEQCKGGRLAPTTKVGTDGKKSGTQGFHPCAPETQKTTWTCQNPPKGDKGKQPENCRSDNALRPAK